jgi:MFS family permease
MMVSSAFWGKLSDRFGRKAALVISGLFLFFYAFLSTFAPSYPWILCLRWVMMGWNTKGGRWAINFKIH